jgi:hypothetical protein
MKKLNEIIDKYYRKVILVMLMLIFFNTCGDGGASKNRKRIEKLSNQVDSLSSIIVTSEDLRIEGLKNELRMIQATDRNLLDVQRQTQIGKEIDSLSK